MIGAVGTPYIPASKCSPALTRSRLSRPFRATKGSLHRGLPTAGGSPSALAEPPRHDLYEVFELLLKH
ncbi:MAG: hypothetical protein K9M81_02320 [Chthoniobacterales bacterium]|nr:hypothetical protein [Chthoniobacterales bacterium]